MRKCALLAVMTLALGCSRMSPIAAQGTKTSRPFSLPLIDPPGPSTWMLEQHYGNTVEAHTFGKYWYAAGQGIHFGVDFETACGTPVHAIADGVVEAVDNSTFGAAPHNLVISHMDAGVVSVYGHLLERSPMLRSQPVKRGDVIGKTGDPDLTCRSRPHLHLEIRSLDYRFAYNPVQYIEADWEMLATLGEQIGVTFAKNLYAPNQWQTVENQPKTSFNNNFINGFEQTWPPPLRVQAQPVTLPQLHAPELDPYAETPLRRLTRSGCCTGFWWVASDALEYIDGPQGDLANVMRIGLSTDLARTVSPAPPALYSPDGTYAVRLNAGRTTVTRLTSGIFGAASQPRAVLTRGAWPIFSPESKQLLWQVRTGDDFPNYPLPQTEIWVSDVDGENARLVRIQAGGSVRWLDEKRLLLVEGKPKESEIRLSVLTLATGQIDLLAAMDWVRWLTVAPGGKHLMFFAPFQPESSKGGIYLLETRAGASLTKLPFVGAWRWRDSDSVVYIPFAPTGENMALKEYHIATGAITDLRTPPFRVANGEWSISPDGRHIAFINARDQAIWIIALSLTPETFRLR